MFSIGERYLIPKKADFIKLKVINTGFEMLSAVTRLDGETFNVTGSVEKLNKIFLKSTCL